MAESGLLAGYMPEPVFCDKLKISIRTSRRMRNQPDGLAYMELGGKIYVDTVDWRDRFLPSRRRVPNPRRARRTVGAT